MALTLEQAIDELQAAYDTYGDIKLDGDLLDLAVLAVELSKLNSENSTE